MNNIISFDMDGTLINSVYSDKVWLEGLPRIYAKEKNISFEEAKTFLFREYEKISDQRVEWYDISYWFNRFHLRSKWQDLLTSYQSEIQPYPEVKDVLKRLSKKYPLIVLSNAKKEFIQIELETTSLHTYFTHIFSSISDFNLVKKTALFYEKICEEVAVDPTNVVHVGDHYQFDYQAPQQIGIKTFYLNRNDQASDKNMVKNLLDFEEKVTSLWE